MLPDAEGLNGAALYLPQHEDQDEFEDDERPPAFLEDASPTSANDPTNMTAHQHGHKHHHGQHHNNQSFIGIGQPGFPGVTIKASSGNRVPADCRRNSARQKQCRELCAKIGGVLAPSWNTCCPKSCGTCGGPGCNRRPGGRYCCQTVIRDMEKLCFLHTQQPPCNLPLASFDYGRGRPFGLLYRPQELKTARVYNGPLNSPMWRQIKKDYYGMDGAKDSRYRVWGPGCCDPTNCWKRLDVHSGARSLGPYCRERYYGEGTWVVFDIGNHAKNGQPDPRGKELYSVCSAGKFSDVILPSKTQLADFLAHTS
ncbi:unnamed protein product [Vitrella brassicaformis CCMP3155]|uniref:Uncharacterized protein n=2 Tax=Vitrella brassicaformis TaxID=1169539 RepID=A0A0G4GLH9_VITBC|nr:unnamed protein product [Vitrella brassicaformis CCMP3155]|eukprot:CEM30990.1 unnamed protein product [Vitrella brassicaformis CCMP3155]